MLARHLTTILLAMRAAEALETTRILRVSGLTGGRTAFITTRPFRAPHYTIAAVGVIGGGHVPMPGEVALAHRGMLFLNELPEFPDEVEGVLGSPEAMLTTTLPPMANFLHRIPEGASHPSSTASTAWGSTRSLNHTTRAGRSSRLTPARSRLRRSDTARMTSCRPARRTWANFFRRYSGRQ
jgi:magnesium chelatase subunit ChlI-like protein